MRTRSTYIHKKDAVQPVIEYGMFKTPRLNPYAYGLSLDRTWLCEIDTMFKICIENAPVTEKEIIKNIIKDKVYVMPMQPKLHTSLQLEYIHPKTGATNITRGCIFIPLETLISELTSTNLGYGGIYLTSNTSCRYVRVQACRLHHTYFWAKLHTNYTDEGMVLNKTGEQLSNQFTQTFKTFNTDNMLKVIIPKEKEILEMEYVNSNIKVAVEFLIHCTTHKLLYQPASTFPEGFEIPKYVATDFCKKVNISLKVLQYGLYFTDLVPQPRNIWIRLRRDRLSKNTSNADNRLTICRIKTEDIEQLLQMTNRQFYKLCTQFEYDTSKIIEHVWTKQQDRIQTAWKKYIDIL